MVYFVIVIGYSLISQQKHLVRGLEKKIMVCFRSDLFMTLATCPFLWLPRQHFPHLI